MGWPHRESRPWIYGHRGVRDMVPENTLLAFEHSLKLGADGIEFDVQIGGDGNLIVFHDATLDRMTAGTDHRRIADVSVDELCTVQLGQGATIPRFSDVLIWANSRQLYLNVELKSEGLDAFSLVAAVEREISEHASDSLKSRLLFSSFAAEILEFAMGRCWPWPLARLLNADDCCQIDGKEFKNWGMHAHFSRIDEAALVYWATSYSFINAWTVNDPNEAKRLATAKIDGIITDHPHIIRNAIE